jgi:hypothetical protein
VGVGLAHVGADRVDDDQRHVANLGNLHLQQIEIGLEIKSTASFAVVLQDRTHDMYTLQISAGSNQARDDGVIRPIFRIEDDHVSNGRASLVAWPLATSRHRGSRNPLVAFL